MTQEPAGLFQVLLSGAPSNTRWSLKTTSGTLSTSSAFTNVFAYYYQVSNTFSVAFTGGNPASGDTLALTGSLYGTSGATILTLNVGGVSSATGSAWTDYNYAVTFPATTANSGTNERWAISSAYATGALTNGGNNYSPSTNYCHQFRITFQYTVSGSPAGSPTNPTATYTKFGTAGTTSTATQSSPPSDYVDAGSSITYTNPINGVSGERWKISPESSASPYTVISSVSSSTTANPTYYHQFQITFQFTISGTNKGSPTNPTATYTKFGTAGTTSTATQSSPPSDYVDAGSSITYTNPINGVSGERWKISPESSASPYTVISSVSSSTTANPTYYHQFQITVTASPNATPPLGGSFSIQYTKFGSSSNPSQNTQWQDWADVGSTATASNAQTAVGSYTFSSYTNNGATMNSAQTITLGYNPTPSVTVSFSVNPVNVGLATTVTATVTWAGGVTPTGTVAFSGGTGSYSPSNQATLSGSGGTATCSVTFTPSSSAGSPVTMSASYGGDGNYAANSGTGSLTVSPHIALVQGPKQGTSTSSTISVSLSNTPASGDVLIATIGTYRTISSTPRTVSSITETGVTWTRQTSQTDTSGNDARDVEIWLGTVGSGASTSISISLSGAPAAAVADVCEYSGIAASSSLDKTAGTYGQSTSTNTGTTSTTAQNSELWIGGIIVEGNNAQTTPTNGFTVRDGAVYNSAMSLAYLEKIVSATGTANSGTTISTSQYWTGCIATFKAA